MVGDVKQSIYKFRQAMPELFLRKYHSYGTIEENTQEGRKIQLFKNFRSRKQVLDFTNLIFQNIMSEKLGDIQYEKEEYLNLGATYPETEQDPKTEIVILNLEEELKEEPEEQSEEWEGIEDIEIEAKYVASQIQEMIQKKIPIYDGKKQKYRPVEFRDIVILLRSTKNKANIYEQELMKQEIPVFSDSTQEYLESFEIQTFMSLLKIIDNPMQDIPLVAVLRSCIGGFIDEELIQIRLIDQQDDFYSCMKKAKLSVPKELGKKIEQFLNQLEQWREEQEYLSLDELIWKIYQETGYYHYVGLMPNGILKQANLKMLFERAKQFESVSFKGLYNFIHYIERIHLHTGDLSSAKIIGENDNVVRIMSIHKSKGLEFPIVFLVNTNKQFNEQDLKQDPILLHQELGMGAKLIDYSKQIQYDTLTREAIKLKMQQENRSEEMRVLYVALTRAKEKLILTGIQKDFSKKKEKLEKEQSIYPKEQGKISIGFLKRAKSYLDWILIMTLFEKEKSGKVFEIKEVAKKEVLEKSKREEKQEEKMKEWKKKENNFLQEERIAQIKFCYPYEKETKIPTKMSVTEIKQIKQEEKERIQEEIITFDKPKFLKQDIKEVLTGSQKGTLLHLCLQKLEIGKEYSLEEVKQWIKLLEKKGKITSLEAENINLYAILNFTKSFIWKELQTAKEIQREKPFYLNLPAKEIYSTEGNEKILVQGMIDLYYKNEKEEWVLVDYKTDYVESGKEDELQEKYRDQLILYRRALEEALQKKVRKTYLYSTYLGKALEIK